MAPPFSLTTKIESTKRVTEPVSAPDRKSRAVFHISVILCKTLHLPSLFLAFPAGDFTVGQLNYG